MVPPASWAATTLRRRRPARLSDLGRSDGSRGRARSFTRCVLLCGWARARRRRVVRHRAVERSPLALLGASAAVVLATPSLRVLVTHASEAYAACRAAHVEQRLLTAASFGQQPGSTAQTPPNPSQTAHIRGPAPASLRGEIGSTMRLGASEGARPRPACHAEGRGFEPLHPLSGKPRPRAVLLLSDGCGLHGG